MNGYNFYQPSAFQCFLCGNFVGYQWNTYLLNLPYVAFFLSACIDTKYPQLQAYFLVLDDIMDGSRTRRGQPCWFKRPEVCFFFISFLSHCSFFLRWFLSISLCLTTIFLSTYIMVEGLLALSFQQGCKG